MNATERLEWLESRRAGIGSSDVAPVLGMSPWQTPLDIYLSKVQPASGAMPKSPPLEWGTRAEPMIAGAIIDHYGWKLGKMGTLTHPKHSFIIASPDRVNEDSEIIEIKTSGRGDGWGEAETGDIPQYYWLQVQHLLACMRSAPCCWVFVLIGGNDFRRYRIERDEEYLPTVLPTLEAFWQAVESRTPPEPDYADPKTLASVNRLFQPKPGTFVALGNEELNYADEYAQLGEQEKELKERRDSIKARLIGAMTEFETAVLPDGRQITRKNVERKGYTVDPCQYVDFRVKKAKGAK